MMLLCLLLLESHAGWLAAARSDAEAGCELRSERRCGVRPNRIERLFARVSVSNEGIEAARHCAEKSKAGERRQSQAQWSGLVALAHSCDPRDSDDSLTSLHAMLRCGAPSSQLENSRNRKRKSKPRCSATVEAHALGYSKSGSKPLRPRLPTRQRCHSSRRVEPASHKSSFAQSKSLDFAPSVCSD